MRGNSLPRRGWWGRSGVQDLFDLLQSPTFVLQLGYGILEILAVSAFPELKPLFRQLERAP